MACMRRIERAAEQADAHAIGSMRRKTRIGWRRAVTGASGPSRHAIFEARQLFGADRPARVHSCRWRCRSRAPKPNSPPSANCVEALCSTIAESTSSRNARAAVGVVGDDRVGVVRAVALDMRDRLVDAVDDFRGDDRVEIFGGPVVLGRGFHARVGACTVRRRRAPRSRRRPASSTSGFRCVVRGRPVDQQRLGRAADAGAPHLGVDDDLLRHLEIGGAVDVDVAHAFEMREHRHARLRLHARDQALAAARHDHVDVAVEAGEHLADRRAVARRHQLDRVFRQAGVAQALGACAA